MMQTACPDAPAAHAARPEPPAPPVARAPRIGSIDALRGLVMLLMLVDHTREFFFLRAQVGDPMDLATTSPGLFFTRLAAHLCAPVFVALTGLSAWLYGAGRPARAVSGFLLRRGVFLIVLEVTLVNFAWTFALPPTTVYLQVIWAIGLAMIALAALVHCPRGWIAAIGAAIVLGHNLLDPVTIAEGQPGHALWAVLHDRGWLDLGSARARTSYPVLPWIGVIALGYAAGPAIAEPGRRRARLVTAGVVSLLLFMGLRLANGYGEPVAWQAGATPLLTAMSFLNLTKYPPSADFLLLTLGIGMLLLAGFERVTVRRLAVLGGAPLFFYLVHLYVLHLLDLVASGGTGRYDVPSVGWIWAIAVLVTPPLWLATRWFAGIKRHSRRWWIRYL